MAIGECTLLIRKARKVLIIGGTGYFGRLIAEDLRQFTNCEVVVPKQRIDLWDAAAVEAALQGMEVVICAAGPFQQLPVTLADICLLKHIHYIDIADDPAFVRKVRALVPPGVRDLPAICTAWSTVSALSALLTQIAAAGLNKVDSIYVHMAPGNRGIRNAATVASLLYSVARLGWSKPRGFAFPSPIGYRTGYLIDVPDLELFPALFGASTVEFRAGSELKILNAAVSLLARIKTDWTRQARLLRRAMACFSFFGSDAGGIGVEVTTSSTKRRVSLIAASRGQRIAAMPASVMTAQLISGVRYHGLVSHKDWLSHDQLADECRKRGFELIMEDL